MPLDKEANQCQYEDLNGGGAMISLVREGGLAAKTSESYYNMVFLEDAWSRALCSHWHNNEWHYADLQDRSLQFSGMHWSRADIVYENWPFKLLQGSVLQGEELDQLFLEFLRAFRCCLDDDAGRPLRFWFPTLDSLKTPEFMSFLLWLAHAIKATNMPLECILNMIKQGAWMKKRKPSIERYAFTGLLTQARHEHISRGRPDGLQHKTSSELIAEGVPVMGERAARAPGYRGDVKWVHQTASASNSPNKRIAFDLRLESSKR